MRNYDTSQSSAELVLLLPGILSISLRYRISPECNHNLVHLEMHCDTAWYLKRHRISQEIGVQRNLLFGDSLGI